VDSVDNFGWTPGKFSVTEDGAAQYNVPLWVPAGRGKVTPQLSLTYNSRAGNGLLGVGWSLSGMSIISWCANTIAQDGYTDGGHFDGTGALCLNGTRLVPISPEWSPQREYRTEQESFTKIIGFETQDNVPDYFKVYTKDGKVLTFGGTAEARVQPYLLLSNPSLAQAPGAPRATTAWVLDRVEDRNGNAATIGYTHTEGDAAELWWTQLRPSEIKYGPNRQVRFIYGDRPDRIDRFSGGTHTRTDVRMSRIEMWGGPEGGNAELLRQYRIRYTTNGHTGRSLLSSFQECDGADRELDSPSSATRRCKVAIPFDYNLGAYKFEELDVDAISEPTPLSVVDINGDGRSDLLEKGGSGPKKLRIAYRDLLSNPDRDGFLPPRNSGLPYYANQTLDVNADGRTEVFGAVPSGDFFEYRMFQPTAASEFEAVPGTLGKVRPFNGNPPPAYLADLDGNGLPDFIGTPIETDQPWWYRLNTGASGENRFDPMVQSTQRQGALGNFAVDTNGDGRTELVAWSSDGYRSWGLSKSGEVQPRQLNLQEQPTAIHFGDVNGDGLVDSVQPYGTDENDGLRVQINSGNGFGPRSAPIPDDEYTKLPFPPSLSDNGVRVVDFNGDGRDDVLVFHGGKPIHGENDSATWRGVQVYTWTDNGFIRAAVLNFDIGSPLGGNSWDNTKVLDMDGDGTLDLVNAGKNGRLKVFQRIHGVPDQLIEIGRGHPRGGAKIRYATLADRNVHIPGTCNYPQICPISGNSVVAEHQVTSDSDSGTAARFTWDGYEHIYEGARADMHGRGWLGFAKHTVIRTKTLASTVTEFDNAYRDPDTKTYPFAQLPKTTTSTVSVVSDATERELRTTTTATHEIRGLGNGTYTVEQRDATTNVSERAVGASQWESLRTTTATTSYDDFGNVDEVKTATTNGRTLTEDVDYANDPVTWLIGLPNRRASTGCTNAGECITRESTFDHDEKGNLEVTTVEPNQPELRLTSTTVYGQFGVVTSVTKTDNTGQSRTDTREYENSDQLYPTATVNAAGHRTEIETHSGLSVPISTRDPNGVLTTFRYDRFGRLRETNRANGSFEHITHSYLGGPQLTTTTNADGSEAAELVDVLGRTRERRITAFDGRTATTYTDHDTLGRGVARTSRATLPGEQPQYTVTTYDNLGRTKSVTAPDGAQKRHEYLNLETHTYDGMGVHSYVVETVDRQVDSIYEDDPNSTNWLRTQFKYWAFGEIREVIAPDNTSQTMHHDTLGRLIRTEEPSRGVTQTTYNAFGEVATITDAENRVTTFDEYDPLGRVKKKTSPDGVAINTWDTALHGIGKLDQATGSDGVTVGHTYDKLGDSATTTWTIGESSYEFSYDYDDIGRLECITYPVLPGAPTEDTAQRLAVGHVYNPQGYLTQVTDGCQIAGNAYWTAEARNGDGQIERERLGNGLTTTHTYRPDTGLLNRIRTTGPGAVSPMADISYDYDKNRNVKTRNDQANQRAEFYHYDVLNRIDSWSVHQPDSGPRVMETTYAYDTVGNLKTETVHGTDQPEMTTNYRYGEDGAPAHWLTSRDDQQYRYDRTGQQISGPSRTVQYNISGLPAALDWVNNEGQARHTAFVYDPEGARILKRDADQTIITVAGLFERRIPAGTDGKEIYNLHNISVDGRVVAQVNRVQGATGGQPLETRTWYLHSDLQGSTTLTSRGNGQLAVQHYSPFGQHVDKAGKQVDNSRRDGPRMGYTGHEHDDEISLINMKGRIYDPETRRFLTPDPIQAPVSSQTHNRYSYVQNNPTTLFDPSGYLPRDDYSDPVDHDPAGLLAQAQYDAKVSSCVVSEGMSHDDCGDILAQIAEDNPGKNPALNGSLSATPTADAAEPTPSSDDDTSTADDVEISEHRAVFHNAAPKTTGQKALAWAKLVYVAIVTVVNLGSPGRVPDAKPIPVPRNSSAEAAAREKVVKENQRRSQQTNSGGEPPNNDPADKPDPVPQAAEGSSASKVFWSVVGAGSAIGVVALTVGSGGVGALAVGAVSWVFL
jgi:RHS repeat-associated protein